MKKRIITICGVPGSGKSSTADGVAEALAYRRFSSGDLMRATGAARGLSVEEISSLAKSDTSIDAEVDAAIQKAGEGEDLVIDSRIAFHWVPNSFKVFLTLDLHIAAQRTLFHIKQEGRVGQDGSSIEEVYKKTLARVEDERKRYSTLYGVNYVDEKNYDLVINTAEHSLADVIRTVVEKYRKWLLTTD